MFDARLALPLARAVVLDVFDSSGFCRIADALRHSAELLHLEKLELRLRRVARYLLRRLFNGNRATFQPFLNYYAYLLVHQYQPYPLKKDGGRFLDVPINRFEIGDAGPPRAFFYSVINRFIKLLTIL